MPVRFRCVYCNQLLGIARRKAGTVVKCPTCAGQIVVPESTEKEDPAENPEPAEPLVFERSDFGKLFDSPAAERDLPPHTVPTDPPHVAQSRAAPPSAPASPREIAIDKGILDVVQSPISVEEIVQPPGIFLSPSKATLLTVLVIVALAVVFGAGLLVGRFVLKSASQESRRQPSVAEPIAVVVNMGNAGRPESTVQSPKSKASDFGL